MTQLNLRLRAFVALCFLSTFLSTSCAAESADSPLEGKEVAVNETVDQLCPPAETTTALTLVSTTKISGIVVYDEDRTTGVAADPPLEGVRIVVFKGDRAKPELLLTTLTDSQGRFRFVSEIEPGEYLLLTCLEGWDAVEVPLKILQNGSEHRLTLQLEPS